LLYPQPVFKRNNHFVNLRNEKCSLNNFFQSRNKNLLYKYKFYIYTSSGDLPSFFLFMIPIAVLILFDMTMIFVTERLRRPSSRLRLFTRMFSINKWKRNLTIGNQQQQQNEILSDGTSAVPSKNIPIPIYVLNT